jgi:hypothetical protein
MLRQLRVRIPGFATSPMLPGLLAVTLRPGRFVLGTDDALSLSAVRRLLALAWRQHPPDHACDRGLVSFRAGRPDPPPCGGNTKR